MNKICKINYKITKQARSNSRSKERFHKANNIFGFNIISVCTNLRKEIHYAKNSKPKSKGFSEIMCLSTGCYAI